MTRLTNGLLALSMIVMMAACSETEDAANDLLVANDVNASIAAENVLVANDGEPTAENAPSEPPAAATKPATATRPSKPPPAPEPEAEEPTADPHAGHDMNNMQ